MLNRATLRFWANTVKSHGCWEWSGLRHPKGYGKIFADGMYRPAHRYSWELHFGPIPEGLQVCHHCDNPPCVRPDHLFVGTSADNARDRERKGRGGSFFSANARRAVRERRDQTGERNPFSVLTADRVKAIRALHASGVGVGEIVRRERVSRGCIDAVVTGRTWRHVK